MNDRKEILLYFSEEEKTVKEKGKDIKKLIHSFEIIDQNTLK